MGCQSCGNSNGVPRGCKSNGTCTSGGCSKLPVFNWLADIELPNGQSAYDIVEIRFKNGRKSFYRNASSLSLQVGDAVAVEADQGNDVGVVSVTGELARIQVRKKAPNLKSHEAQKIIRKASSTDIERWVAAREKENDTMYQARVLASALGLAMKISDVEYQADGKKATFYYTADERVDFRQLIRDLAEKFSIRIEMKQIGARQEAARLGGIGSCGRELCCTTWLTDFRSVSTASARYQQLSLNQQKLAGQCGKLKCCLNFELDTYVEALKAFPRNDIKLRTKKGRAFHVKTDVFKGLMWYLFESGSEGASAGFVPLKIDRVHEIIALNKAGEEPLDLKEFVVVEPVKVPDYTNVVGQDSLNRFEHVFKRKKKKKSNKNRVNSKQKNTSSSNSKSPNHKNEQKADGNRPPRKKNNRPKKTNSNQNQSSGNAKQAQKQNKPKSSQNSENKPKRKFNPNKRKSKSSEKKG
ncbi:MAG: stage 0 sporulation family protein [Crocinitomicaceae bacterium]